MRVIAQTTEKIRKQHIHTHIYIYIYTYIHTCIYIYIYIYIYNWRVFSNCYRKLAWVAFETRSTEFRSDSLTDWTIRPWVQLALRPLHSDHIAATVFVSRHICFKQNLAQVIMLVAEMKHIFLLTTNISNLFRCFFNLKSKFKNRSKLAQQKLENN